MSSLHSRMKAQAAHRTEEEERERKLSDATAAASAVAADQILFDAVELALSPVPGESLDYEELLIVAHATGHQVLILEEEDGSKVYDLVRFNPCNRRDKANEEAEKRYAARKRANRFCTALNIRDENESYLRDLAAEMDYPPENVEMYRLQQYARRVYSDEPESLLVHALILVTDALDDWYRKHDLAELFAASNGAK